MLGLVQTHLSKKKKLKDVQQDAVERRWMVEFL